MKKLIFILICLFLLPICAHAQDDQIFIPMGTKYDNTGANVHALLKQQELSSTNKMPAGSVEVSIVHPDYLDPTQFGLMIQKSNTETGCFDYSPLEYEANYIENYYMDIEVKSYRRTKKETQNPEYDCDQKSKVISGLIILDVNNMKQKNLQQIRFSNGDARDTYNVAFIEDGVRLIPQSMIAFKAQGLQGADQNYLEYKFDDKTLITLQVPMAQEGEDVTEAVRDLAQKNGLQPVFEREGLDTSGKNNVFYFTDPNMTAQEQIGETGYAEFGTINVTRPYDGPEGRMAMPVPLKVFLTRPNVTL